MDAAWLGAEGEESVNPVFLGDVTAVFREEENALLCSQGLGEVSPRRMVGMRRGVEISCLAQPGLGGRQQPSQCLPWFAVLSLPLP